MADDNEIEIRFVASTDEALAAIGQMRASLVGLSDPLAGLRETFDQLNDQVLNVGASIKVIQQNFAGSKVLLNAEVSQFQITQNQKFALLEAEAQQEYAIELGLLAQKLAIDGQSVDSRANALSRIAALEARHRTDMIRLDEQSIAAQQSMWNGYLSNLTSAFNTQLRGLLEGTTSWKQASVKVFEDLTIKFIELAEQMVVKWAAAQLAQTTAATSGAAARAAAETAASSSGILANAANAIAAIMTDAAQTFAGVFAFLAPVMGPAAAGPAAAAQASVSAAAIFDVGTDYVVRGGLALIHAGETVVPAARGSGPYTGTNMGAQIHAPVSINISALDSQSVARFFNDNSRHMLRAISDAVKRGAHLGLRARNP